MKSLRRRSLARRALGLLGIAPFPILGFAFPMATIIGIPALLAHPLNGWPRYVKLLVAGALGGAVVILLSGQYQSQSISSLVVHYVALALFVLSAVKLTASVSTGGQLLFYASIGSGLFYFVFGSERTSDSFEHLWKYGIAVPVTVIILWWTAQATPSRLLPVIVLAAIGATSIFLGFRSHGLVCVVAFMVVFIKGRTRRRMGIKYFGAASGMYLLGVLLPNAISTGVFGEEVQRRTLDQTAQGASPLLAGRVEPPLSMAAIAEKPFLGWGNTSNIGTDTVNTAANLAINLGLHPNDFMRIWIRDDGGVSLHSIFFEGWATGGILGAAMPAVALLIFVGALFAVSGRYTAFVVFVAAQGCWDIIFSPWGHNKAFILGLSLVVCAWAIGRSPKKGFQHTAIIHDEHSSTSEKGMEASA